MSDTLYETLKEPKVYKVNYIVNGLIDTTIVFNGTNKSTEFTEKENVKYSDQTIHFDDSIGTIKIKILNELNKLKKAASLDEIYLYYQKYLF